MAEEYVCIQCGMETNEIRCPRCKLNSCVDQKKLESCFGADWVKRKKAGGVEEERGRLCKTDGLLWNGST